MTITDAIMQCEEIPNPGSNAAREAGCKCPVIDNGYGRGARPNPETGEPLFWITEGCPLHDKLPRQE